MRGFLWKQLHKSELKHSWKFTLPIRNLIYNISLGAYLPYVVNRDREDLPQEYAELQMTILTLV